VAGYEAQALELEPADDYRYGHRFWAETKTGLLLKASMLDENNQVIEQFKFTHLSIGPGITRQSVQPSFNLNSPDLRRETVGPESAALGDTGWAVQRPPAGFKKVMEIKRIKSGTRSPVAHLVYSDGLAAISVFVESSPPKQRVYQVGLSRQGAVHIFTRVLQDEIVTVLGEAPALTVMQMAESVSKAP
jgi:sigma-E factor negative regulatory protein RseB